MRTTTAGIAVLILVVAAIFVPILSCPYCHKHKVSLLLWIARELEEAYSGERRTENCIPDVF